jgi:nucleoid-associated protein YgaU
MPVSLTSRYAGIAVYDAQDASGATHPTVPIRPSTIVMPNTTSYQHTVVGVETVEYLAWRYYGSSAAWWRIAEANPLIFPLDITTGIPLAIPAPGDVGRIERTRSF